MSTIPGSLRVGTHYETWDADTQYTPQMLFGGFNNNPLLYGSPVVFDIDTWYIALGPQVPVLGTHPASDAAWTALSTVS